MSKTIKLIIILLVVSMAVLGVSFKASANANNRQTVTVNEPHMCYILSLHPPGYAYANESAVYGISPNLVTFINEAGISNVNSFSDVQYDYYNNWQESIAGFILGPIFATPPLNTTGSYLSPVSDAKIDYSGIQNGQTGLFETVVSCDSIPTVYQNYQAYVAYDSNGNQISSDEDVAGNVTKSNGISLNATSGQQTSFNLTLKPSFSSSNTYYDGSAMTPSPDQSPLMTVVYQTTKEYGLFLYNGVSSVQSSQSWASPVISGWNGVSLPININASSLTAGTYSTTLTINPPSGSYFAPTYVPITVTVVPPPLTVTISASSSVPYNQPTNVNYSVGNAYGYQIFANNNLIGSIGVMTTSATNYYSSIAQGTTTLGTVMIPRCSCDVSAKLIDCGNSQPPYTSTFSTNDSVGSVCYDNFLTTDAPAGVCHDSYCYYTYYGLDGYQKYIAVAPNKINISNSFNLNLTTSTTFVIKATGPGGELSASTTVTVLPPSSYTPTVTVSPTSTSPGGTVLYTQIVPSDDVAIQPNGVPSPLVFQVTKSQQILQQVTILPSSLRAQNRTSISIPLSANISNGNFIQGGEYNVNVGDIYNYTSSAPFPPVAVDPEFAKYCENNTDPVCSGHHTPLQLSLSGGQNIFYVTTSTSQTVNLNISSPYSGKPPRDWYWGQNVVFLPQFANSNGLLKNVLDYNYGSPTINTISNMMSEGSFISKMEAFDDNSKSPQFMPASGNLNEPIKVGCDSLGIWRVKVNSLSTDSNYITFAVAPDPRYSNACGN